MKFELQTATEGKKPGQSGEARAFVLLESARLRCEALIDCVGSRTHLVAIHREIGLAGYVTCEAFDEAERRQCLALATAELSNPLAADGKGGESAPDIGRTLARMFSETISASDALAGELSVQEADDAHRDRLHLVHAHVMSACELLDERLTVLELQGAGVDAVTRG